MRCALDAYMAGPRLHVAGGVTMAQAAKQLLLLKHGYTATQKMLCYRL